MKKRLGHIIIIILFFIAAWPIAASSVQNVNTNSQGSSPQTKVLSLAMEMTAQENAFNTIVTAVVLSDQAKVHTAIKPMSDSLERTLEGVRAGTILLPKNAANTSEFIKMDLKFRNKLEALDRAARHGNQREMQRITNLLLGSCITCHQKFRK